MWWKNQSKYAESQRSYVPLQVNVSDVEGIDIFDDVFCLQRGLDQISATFGYSISFDFDSISFKLFCESFWFVNMQEQHWVNQFL